MAASSVLIIRGAVRDILSVDAFINPDMETRSWMALQTRVRAPGFPQTSGSISYRFNNRFAQLRNRPDRC